MSGTPQKPFRAERQRAAFSDKQSGREQKTPDVDVFNHIDTMMVAIERLEKRVSVIADNLNQTHLSTTGSLELADTDASQIITSRAAVLRLRHIQDGGQTIFSAAEELSDVISQTEAATGEIIDACEAIDETVIDLIDTIQHEIADDKYSGDLNSIRECIMRILQASSFQDLTGQRITRVTRMLIDLEDRLGQVETALGISPADIDAHRASATNRSDHADPSHPHFDETRLLNGPATGGDGISQDDIDKLFG